MARWPNLGALLGDRAERHPDRELFRFEGRSRTFGQVEEETNRLANALAARGIGKGDPVALMIPNGFDFPMAWLALAKLGALMVPLNVQYRVGELAYVLNDSGAVAAIAGPGQLALLSEVRPRCPKLREIVTLGGGSVPGGVPSLEDLAAKAGTAPVKAEVGLGDLLSIQYTSGTTGFPKGCLLTHDYIIRMGAGPAHAYQVGDRDVMLTAQPFYYLDPQWSTTLCLVAGCPLVILPRFSASTFWRSVKEQGVTLFYVLGTMPVYLYKQPPDPAVDRGHGVRLALCSGIPADLHGDFERRWGVPWRELYGSTESGIDLVVPAEDVASVGSGAMGKALPGREAEVVDPEGHPVADGDVGELVLRGEGMMVGYHNNPDATAEKLRGGWLYTGDRVFRDSRGFFHMVGRTKDMIRRTGENIAAAEVEAALCQHPAVRAAAVVPVPDELRGEEVKAFVQLQPGVTVDSVPPTALVEFVRQRLAPFKAPRYIEYVDQFPLTPSEKIAKHELLRRQSDQRVGSYDAATQRWG